MPKTDVAHEDDIVPYLAQVIARGAREDAVVLILSKSVAAATQAPANCYLQFDRKELGSKYAQWVERW